MVKKCTADSMGSRQDPVESSWEDSSE